jgi:hypothetical protein
VLLLEPDNRVFLGMGGEGKSHLARHQSWTVAPRVVICDPNAEPAWASGALVVDDPVDLCHLLKEQEARVCWRGFDTMGEEAGFLWANRAALAAGDCLIVWDEVDFFFPYIKPDTSPYRLWNAGRHQGCRCFAIARSALAVRLSSMVSKGPPLALHQNASGATSMRILGVDVTMPALAFGAGCVMLLIAAVRR